MEVGKIQSGGIDGESILGSAGSAISGVADKVGDAFSDLKDMGADAAKKTLGIPEMSQVESRGKASILNIFSEVGFPIGWLALLVLAGGILVPPFHYLGMAGLNLMTKDATLWGFLKAIISVAGFYLGRFSRLYAPKLWPLHFILKWNPWFVFDILQTLSPAFVSEGYKIPFLSTHIGSRSGEGRLTIVVIGLAIGILALGGYDLFKKLPKEVTGTATPILKIIITIVGAVGGIMGGGFGAYFILPKVIASVRSSAQQAQAAAFGAATGGAEQVAVPAAAVAVPQAGGASRAGDFPSLQQVAEGMIAGAPQAGGARAASATEAQSFMTFAFLGSLAVVTLGGISLALVRSKIQPLEK